MMPARLIAGDWVSAQRRLMELARMQRMHRIALSTDPDPQAMVDRARFHPMNETMYAQWTVAVLIQLREARRCGWMLAANFSAANDDGGEEPSAA